jgi:sulfite reductase subunit B
MATALNEKSIYAPIIATVEETRQITATEKYFKIVLNSGKELGHLPGQFVEVSILGVGEAPISISSSPTQKGYFELGVRKVGNVTGAMHNLKAGDKLGVRGPFGTNFPFEQAKGKDVLFVAGGIGLFPARSFINYVLHNRKDYKNVTILFGARTPSDRVFTDELADWSKRDDVNFFETVDRGDPSWKGNTGVITTLFPKAKIDAANTVCVIVGPPIMYKFAIAEAKKSGIADSNIYVSLERNMKCGVGKCGHCQINNLYCCQDGPVFQYSAVQPIPEAF